jgi:hypothetical protein
VAYNIVNKHGGSIGAESSGVPCEDSRFFFDIPVSRTSATDKQQDGGQSLYSESSAVSRYSNTDQHDISASCSTSDSTSRRILKAPRHRALVVDDSSLNRKMLKNVVKRYFSAVLEVSE